MNIGRYKRSLKVVKLICRLDIRRFSFAHCIVDIWNGLDESIIAQNSITGFKNRIDKFLHSRGLYKPFISFLPSIHTKY